jgi:hypothetical protein
MQPKRPLLQQFCDAMLNVPILGQMRGSSVIGASIHDSHNRWLTVHGTNYLVVRDCVGYRSVGHGFFLEDGTEVYNVLDRNLAVAAKRTKRLPKQVLSFDENNGAGFWWANSLNTFTRNVAAENDNYGFRYEASAGSTQKLVFPVQQPDGTKLPFSTADTWSKYNSSWAFSGTMSAAPWMCSSAPSNARADSCNSIRAPSERLGKRTCRLPALTRHVTPETRQHSSREGAYKDRGPSFSKEPCPCRSHVREE